MQVALCLSQCLEIPPFSSLLWAQRLFSVIVNKPLLFGEPHPKAAGRWHMKGSSWVPGSVGMWDQTWKALEDVGGEAEAGNMGNRWDQVYILHSFPPRALPRWGGVSPPPYRTNSPRSLQPKGIRGSWWLRVCFRPAFSIASLLNQTPALLWDADWRCLCMCSFLSFKLHFKLGNISEIF